MAIRKYDKVYVPGSHERPNFSIDDFKNGSKTHVDELSDIIVMSEEELSEYCAAFFRWWWNEKGTNTTHAADDYVKNVNPPTA